MGTYKILEVGLGEGFGIGGAEVIVWNWYRNFDHSKVSVDFWGPMPSKSYYINYLKGYGDNFIPFYARGNKIIKKIDTVLSLNKFVKHNKYDCIHIHASDSMSAFIHFIAVSRFCHKIIIHSHSSGMGGASSVVDNKMKIKCFIHKICRKLIQKKQLIRLSCSDSAGKWLFSEKYPYTIIKNGIETLKFIYNKNIRKKVQNELKIKNKFVIGHVGRFTYEKNHSFLIDIFYEINQKNSNAVLLLIGTGELEDSIKERVHRLGLDDVVVFCGTSDKVNELYQAMDCFLFPSHFEGLGIAVIEAQAAGLKTLCSDAVPPEAKITDLLEYMSLSQSAKKWSEKLLSYNEGYERKDMSEEIRSAGYDITQSAKQVEALYCD